MKLLLSLLLLVVCLTEALVEEESNIGEQMAAVIMDMPVSGGSLSIVRPPVEALNDPPSNITSLNDRFEQLMTSCGKESWLMRATAWDLVMVVAVVAVSLAEARLLCSIFVGPSQLHAADGGSVKAVRLTLQSTTPQHISDRPSNIVLGNGVLNVRRQYTSC